MSMYWTGYHGQGLVLSTDEFDAFLDVYVEKVKEDAMAVEQLEDWKAGCIDIAEVEFLNSSGGDMPFDIIFVGDDCEGFHFTPFRIGQKPNMEWEAVEIGEKAYIIDSDRDIDNMESFEKKAYESYEDFVQEFKDKCAGYLPDDFDWDAHLGMFDYARFA